MGNLDHWNNLKSVPTTALKPIKGGRLAGKSDINPQWRYESMTKEFGVCGIGWKYEIVKTWAQEAPNNQVMVFVEINLYIKDGDSWSAPIPAIGGDFVLEEEKSGIHANDEAYKMATTDALGVAMKMLGVAADVYMGLANDSKYGREKESSTSNIQQAQKQIAEEKAMERQERQDNNGVKWKAFWQNAENLRMTEDQVHVIAGEVFGKEVKSLTDVIKSQLELNRFTTELRKRAQKTA